MVRAYATEHAMARSLGKPDEALQPGRIDHPFNGMAYELRPIDEGGDDGKMLLKGTYPDGGTRIQQVVGRIGAGVYDRSWVTAETDVVTGEITDRLYFAPVEHLTDADGKPRLTLSPFEQSRRFGGRTAGLDKPVTYGCIRCHSGTPVEQLPSAALAHGEVYPPHHLGADAFDVLEPLGCDACHGDSRRHLELMRDPATYQKPLDDIGLVRLGDLDAGLQRDVCATCHLDGDVHLDLSAIASDHGSMPLEWHEPNLRTRPEDPDAFRFVGQVERLVESSCFQNAAVMTCNTCHDPHRGVASQGSDSFNRACLSCHGDENGSETVTSCARPASLRIQDVTGSEPRSAQGCVDCHVRRSSPHDLPGVVTADHKIRRNISPPSAVTYRKNTGLSGPIERITDGRLDDVYSSLDGRRRLAGIYAMAALEMKRSRQEVADYLERYDRLSRESARQKNRNPKETAPPWAEDLEESVRFHRTRAQVAGFNSVGIESLQRALDIAPENPEIRLALADMYLAQGKPQDAWAETERVLKSYPKADRAFALQASIAAALGRPDQIRQALENYVAIWPSDAGAWSYLAKLLEDEGQTERAAEARARAKALPK